MNSLVSLITPFFNAMPYFSNYLDSVLSQTWRPLELTIVDDGSVDDSWKCLMNYLPALERAEISVYPLRIAHSGQAAAVNEALPLVSGEFLTWCDADDYMTPDSIEKKARYLKQFSRLRMVRSDGIVFDGDSGQRLSHSAKETDRFTQNIFDALFHGETYCYAGCYMVRTEWLFSCYPKKAIPLSEEGQNLQLLLPLASRSDCGFLPEVLHFYYRRSAGHSSKKRSFCEAKARLENFSALRQRLLAYCLCDRDYYLEENRKITKEAQSMLLYTAANRAREEMQR